MPQPTIDDLLEGINNPAQPVNTLPRLKESQIQLILKDWKNFKSANEMGDITELIFDSNNRITGQEDVIINKPGIKPLMERLEENINKLKIIEKVINNVDAVHNEHELNIEPANNNLELLENFLKVIKQQIKDVEVYKQTGRRKPINGERFYNKDNTPTATWLEVAKLIIPRKGYYIITGCVNTPTYGHKGAFEYSIIAGARIIPETHIRSSFDKSATFFFSNNNPIFLNKDQVVSLKFKYYDNTDDFSNPSGEFVFPDIWPYPVPEDSEPQRFSFINVVYNLGYVFIKD